ncbi:GNAT family N-acetyltransferase [Camelliibacillus cellulosilyticus]|uniref:GNAT family N-acetyltransferase n=1 Tax=Camelliibacillus cellulosilyticus TaxID=2174486 RepID=A0ABV9GLV4_9BACL
MTLKIGSIRPYQPDDFIQIQQLNDHAGWTTSSLRPDAAKQAWEQSNIAYVIEENKHVIGYVRGLTDQKITLFICELLIDKNYRGLGLGHDLLKYVHQLYPETRMEMLATKDSQSFYEHLNFRRFNGFRKMINE